MTSSASRSPTPKSGLPAEFSKLDIGVRSDSSTSTPNIKGALITVNTPPDSACIHGAVVDSPIAKGDGCSSVFVQARADDDVFGDGKPSLKVGDIGHAANEVGVTATTPKATYVPRADRLKEPITPMNAQGVLPPEACVFVANLSIQRSNSELAKSCEEVFKQFGPCEVQVHLDPHRHPFALVQYYKVEDADLAIEKGRGVRIDGREIRTERGESRRFVVLERAGGGPITADEARGLLGKYGPISQMFPTTHQEARDRQLPEGMWVEFAYYLDFRDALKSFNNTTSLFRIHAPPAAKPRARGPGGFKPLRSTTDQRSIFVGNLPNTVTEEDLRHTFGAFGTIISCNIIRKPIQGGVGFNIFGFIEYTTTQEADAAADAEIDLNGQRIRVEAKEYSARRHTRLQQYTPSHYSRANTGHRSFGWSQPNNMPYYQQPQFFSMTPQSMFDQNRQYRGMHQYAHAGHPWATPPATIGRVTHPMDMTYQNSPHHGQYWAQYAFPPPQYGGTDIAPICENESNEQQYCNPQV